MIIRLNKYCGFGGKRTAVIGGILGTREFGRLARSKREERVNFVIDKIVSGLVKYGGSVSEADFKELIKSRGGVVYRRGKIRVNGLKAVIIPLSNHVDFSEFKQWHENFWKICVKFRRLQRAFSIARRLLGNNIFDGGKTIATWKFFLNAISFLRYGKPYCDLKRNGKAWALKMYKYEKLGKLLRSKGAVSMVFWGWFRRLKRTPEVLRNLFLAEQGVGDVLRELRFFESKLPFMDLWLWGEQRLTRRQSAKLRGRREGNYYIALWDLLFNTPAIKKEYNFTSRFKVVVQLSWHGLFVYVPRWQKGLRFGKFLVPAVIQANPGIPVDKTSSRNYGDMMFPNYLGLGWEWMEGLLKSKMARKEVMRSILDMAQYRAPMSQEMINKAFETQKQHSFIDKKTLINTGWTYVKR